MFDEHKGIFARDADSKGREESILKGKEKVFGQQKSTPVDARSTKGGDMLSKLERDGKIPSKEKFRLLPCNVILSITSVSY